MVDGQDQDPKLDLRTEGNQWKSLNGLQGLRAGLSWVEPHLLPDAGRAL